MVHPATGLPRYAKPGAVGKVVFQLANLQKKDRTAAPPPAKYPDADTNGTKSGLAGTSSDLVLLTRQVFFSKGGRHISSEHPYRPVAAHCLQPKAGGIDKKNDTAGVSRQRPSKRERKKEKLRRIHRYDNAECGGDFMHKRPANGPFGN
jgi:hypothetical protein